MQFREAVVSNTVCRRASKDKISGFFLMFSDGTELEKKILIVAFDVILQLSSIILAQIFHF